MRLSELRRGAVVAVATVLSIALVSCTDGGQENQSVTGEIVNVVPQSIDTVETLTIRDGSGEVWTFGPARMPHFTPSHLIEHQANGDRITIFFREEPDGTRTIVSVEEAAP